MTICTTYLLYTKQVVVGSTVQLALK